MASLSPQHTGSLPFARYPLRFLPCFALLSLALVATQVALHLRNIPYWDEVDGALGNLLRIDLTQPLPDGLANLFALQNEHRTFTSNLLFATIYRLTGTLNFAAIAVVGNLFLLGTCAVLIERAGSWTHRARLAAVIGLVVVHLQHHESLFWAGSSIDHFHVVLLAVAAFAALSDGTRPGFRLVLPRNELPAEAFAVGVLLKRPWTGAEFTVSNRQLGLSSGSSSVTRLLTPR